jgi:aspartate kinase
MSGSVKSEGTTSMLMEACREVLTPNSKAYIKLMDNLEENHIKAANEALYQYTTINQNVVSNGIEALLKSSRNCNVDILHKLETDIKAECDRLRQFMIAAEVIDEISPRSQDFIISAGEKLSALIFTSVLQCQNIKAKYFSLDKLVLKKFDIGAIDQSFYDYLVAALLEKLIPYVDDHICVVTGFLGPIPGGILSTIGRGYTDLTAALIAVAFNAKELQIWKEVDGIFTADPRKVPLAKKINTISPEEAAELT